MTIVDCPREQDILDAVTNGLWPDRADADLRSHVSSCPFCTDFVSVVQPLLHEHASDEFSRHARIPSSAVMWWRAQMRARQEAAREAARPITVAQIVAGSTAAIVAIFTLAALSPWLRTWCSSLATSASLPRLGLDLPALLLGQGWLLPALVIGLWLVLTPVAIYLAVAED